ncbi:MAG TPA: (2Fe-2S) ferredoxin domain-containing protein [Candidatus Stercoripulliclostridium merdipullorum]|uniref:(2Fe-2S) ferredoxin domain-containing protein n=1 Tax=Candidatus Stercoripulliclostridium merdipullorum TaxID=2840952 RepID=A0A9D1NAJ9_9FIRM|nr:(2Fe-2S) ferredoxin domain-containing protein [Candidatus Stercoripulliclostridium merdipullorum]
MKISVCVGSSCHLKGSYDVIEEFKKVIKKYDVEDVVELQASFCLGHCAEGVTVKADDQFLFNVNRDNVEDVFVAEIYPKVR